MKKISVLIPVFNEEASLLPMYERLSKMMTEQSHYEWELVFVDDGSQDQTAEMLSSLRAKDKRVVKIELSRNFGKENAMLAGLDYVSSDATIIMDGDLQHPVEVIPQMLAAWEEGFQDVYARRHTRGKESWLRKRLSLIFYKMLQSTSRFNILQNVGDFRLLDRRCVKALCQMRENQRYTKGMYAWIGFRKKEILFDQQDRQFGHTSFSYRKLFGLAVDGLTSFTTTPLRISTIFGLVVSLAAFAYLLYILVKTIIIGDPVQGFPTLVILILFSGGLQLLSIGIIGEYIARIFNETKQRPNYIINTINDLPS